MLLAPTAANACIVYRESHLEEIRQADVVFVGDITSYEIVERDSGYGHAIEEGLLTINVTNTIKGSAPSTVKLAWPNSTFGFAPEMRTFRLGIYAATYDPSGFPEELNAHLRSDQLYLFQPPCSGGFAMPHSEADEGVIRQVLAGSSATFDDLRAWGDVEVVQLKAIRRSESPEGVAYGVILVAITFLICGLVAVWRTRQKPSA